MQVLHVNIKENKYLKIDLIDYIHISNWKEDLMKILHEKLSNNCNFSEQTTASVPCITLSINIDGLPVFDKSPFSMYIPYE